MNEIDTTYETYRIAKRLIERIEACCEKNHIDAPLFKEWKEFIKIFDGLGRGYAEQYEKVKIMNALYDLYKNSRDSLARYDLEKKDYESQELQELDEIINELKKTIKFFDRVQPQFKEQYMRNKEIQKSFTLEQIDHICYQIGDWYLMMKPLLEGQHNLGHMKEKLKSMICGE